VDVVSTAAAESPIEAIEHAEHDHNQPLELTEEEHKIIDSFHQEGKKLASMFSAMRATHTRIMNGIDSARSAEARYREQRDAVRKQMNATYDAALETIRYLPYDQAASYVATTIQVREATDIYSADTYEGAARLIDGGLNYLYLYMAAGRSAVVSGHFDKAKLLFEAIEEDKREKHDNALLYNLESLEANFKREQEMLEADAKKGDLPQVLIKTTRGDIVVELFLEQAPSTVSNFIGLVESGYYDGTDFYQVIDRLLALTGDPAGQGVGPQTSFIVDEYDMPHARMPMRGSLMMAKIPMGEKGEFVPNSASTHFTILYLPFSTAREQTVFGRVIEGMDVASSLRRVDPMKEKGKTIQVPPDRIISAEVIRRPKELPPVKYGTIGKR
jgi:peptidylprolyl isomerase